MDDLIFSRDGVLRRYFGAYDTVSRDVVKRLVPLLAWEAGVDKNVFLKSLSSGVSFEDGLTVGEMMENLSPWADVMTGVACMDFPAFLEESRRGGERVKDISRIELRYQVIIEAVPRFERVKPAESDSGKRDLESVLGLGRPLKTDKISAESRWEYSALLTDDGRARYDGSESVSLSFTPVSEYAHLPLVINPIGSLLDQTPFGRRYLNTKLPLLNPDNPLTERVEGSSVLTLRSVINAPSPNFFDTLVGGLLWDMGFSYSPAQRDASAESLKRRVDDIRGDGSVSEPGPEPEVDEEFCSKLLLLKRAEEAALDLGLNITEPPPVPEKTS